MNTIKILIVESEPIVAMDIASTLEKHGFSGSTYASSEADAYCKLSEGGADLILFDESLKGRNGSRPKWETVARKRKIPVIYLSTQPSGSGIRKPGSRKQVCYLRKPFNTLDIPPLVHKCLAMPN